MLPPGNALQLRAARRFCFGAHRVQFFTLGHGLLVSHTSQCYAPFYIRGFFLQALCECP